MMKLADLDRVQELSMALNRARDTLRAFEKQDSATVEVFASCDLNMGVRHRVRLKSIPKDEAVNVARREVREIELQLAELGVEASAKEVQS
jgi:hypothetical protein